MSRLIDWESVCLVCLQKGENRFIFGEDNDSNVIADKIMKCADILIKRDTNQPKNICFQCLDDLNVAYKFRRNCEQSDSIIKSLLNTNHQEFEIKDLWKTTPITVNQTLDVSIKDEIVDNVVGDAFENTLLKDDPDTEDKRVEDHTTVSAHSNDVEINNVKPNQSNESIKEVNFEISRRPRGRPKKLTEESCTGASLTPVSKNKPQKICKICDRSFKFKNRFDSHMRRHNNERPFNCDYCDKAFVTAQELQCHVRVHTGQKPLKCQYCDRRFSDYSVRKNHESTHTGEKPYVCPTCGKSFGYSNGLTKHLRTHTGVKKFECKECGKEFTRKALLEIHMIRHLTRDELDKLSEHKQKKRLEKEIFQIEENANSNEITIKHEIVDSTVVEVRCDNESTSDLKDNSIAAQNDKIMPQRNSEISRRSKDRPKKPGSLLKVCEICNHGFRDQTALDDHIRRHNQERPFSCDFCGKAFVSISELRRHMRVHTGQKPLKCQYCDRRFSNHTVRKNHERTHTGERPYMCPTCGKNFAYHSVLVEHVRIHTGVKKFVCKECGKGFTRKVHFEKHVACHPTRDELGKSFEHKQKRLEKETFQIEENATSNEINIKHEIVDSTVAHGHCDYENTPCLDLNDDSISEEKNDKIIQLLNGEISKHSRDRSRKTVEEKVCEIRNHCSKEQTAPDADMRHHNNAPPFSCDHCDKGFATTQELQCHVRVHIGQYKCQHCDRRFSDYSVRKNHESTHTGERPYICQTCGKSFATYSHGLKRHLLIHKRNEMHMQKMRQRIQKKADFEKHVTHHLTQDELDKSSDQKKLIEREVGQIGECPSMNAINMKHEMELIEEEVI